MSWKLTISMVGRRGKS